MNDLQLTSKHIYITYFKCIMIFSLMFHSHVTNAQDMSQGFNFLEKGNFENAETFFQKILKEHPTNITAKICYGRAVGLSGNSEKAVQIFRELDELKPNNTEILLNMAEAHLWDNNGIKALEIFQNIVAEDSTLFNGWLGLANSYSVEKIYEKAYQSILVATNLDPSNQQALTSKKYIVLGYADQLSKEKTTLDKSFQLLDENLNVNPKDPETLALKASILIVQKRYQEALEIYETYPDSIKSYQGQSTAYHLLGNEKQANLYGQKFLNYVNKKEDNTTILKAKLHYLNILLWDNQLKNASVYLDTLTSQYPAQPEMELAKAKVAVYISDYLKGVAWYQKHLIANPSSFEGNLALADTWHALGMEKNAYRQAFNTLTYYPGQPDALNFINKLNKSHNILVSGLFQMAFSSDGSSNQSYGFGSSMSFTPHLKLKADYIHRKYFTANPDESSESKKLSLQLTQKINPRLQLVGAVDFFNSRNLQEGASTSSNQLFNLKADVLVSKTQQLSIGYQSDIQDFNHNLLLENLKTNHLVFKNIFNWKISGLGNYTEIYRSFLSDGNSRSLLFTSFYKNLGKKRYVKTGVNLLHFSFANQTITYFSPRSSNQAEVFLSYTRQFKTKNKIKVSAETAVGQQLINDTGQGTWRSSLNISGEFGRCFTKIYALHSTAVTAASNGFSFSQLGIEVRFNITNSPIFYKRLIKNMKDNK